MVQLAAGASATDRLLRVTGELDSIQPHARFRIGNELVDLFGFDKYPLVGGRRRSGLDKTGWMVIRGVGGSTPTAHDAGTNIVAAVTASVSGEGTQPPAPFPGDGGTGDGSGSAPHTHDDYAASSHQHQHSHPENADADHSHAAPDLSGYATVDHTHEGGTGEHDHDSDYAAAAHSHDLTGYAEVGHTHNTAHEHDADYADTDHTHDYADPSHTHAEAAHDHDADYAATGHTHDTSHTHDTTHSHTASDVGAATAGHTHDLSALATDAEVTAAIAAHVQAETHGGGASHTHTVQGDPGTLSLSGNTNQQIGQLRDAINADRAVLRAAGIIG